MVAKNATIGGPAIKEQASQFARELDKTSFSASNGWLESFIKRNNIVFKTQSGERSDVRQTSVDDWMGKLQSLCEGYTSDNIFNMAETGLFFRDLSSRKTYTVKGADSAETVSIVTADGRIIVGMLKGFDQTINLILDESHERVYSTTEGVEQVILGLYIVRGDNVAVIGEIDDDTDSSLDFPSIKAEPLNSVVH